MEQTRIPKLLTEQQTADILGKSVNTLRCDRWQKRGVPYVKMGNHVRYKLETVLNYIEEHTVAVSNPE